MKYNLNNFNPLDFERLIQSLIRKILGNGSITFGIGPDGGREATFEGKAPYPSNSEEWHGYWVVQAKYKETAETNKKDYAWFENQFVEEMRKYEDNKTKLRLPENYLFFTNIKLTAKNKTGGRDKIETLKKKYINKLGIKNISFLGCDDIHGFLDNNRDVATSYASFILSGDILKVVYDFFINKNKIDKDKSQNIGRFLEKELKDELFSKLEDAGKLTNERVNLERVFVDLNATLDGIEDEKHVAEKFVSKMLFVGNHSMRKGTLFQNKYVLIAGPGYGKSTITQFLSQVYRAHFLTKKDKAKDIMPEVKSFITSFNKDMNVKPKIFRLPIRIELKEYSAWLAKKKSEDKYYTVLHYIKYRLEKKGNTEISLDDVSNLMSCFSFLFVFDGLDEVPSSSNRDEVLKEINDFVDIDIRRLDCDALIIATTRPQGYSKEFDNKKYYHLVLTDLNETDCLTYLRRLLPFMSSSEEKNEKYLLTLKDAFNNNMTSVLMKSPLQASIMAILVISGGEPPNNKYDLFSEYYLTIFKREQQKDVIPILKKHQEYINNIHFELGYKLQLTSEMKENPVSSLSMSEFKDLIEEYLKGLQIDKIKIDDFSNEIINAITQRLVFISEVEDGRVGFVIKSIQEYFAANFYLQHHTDIAIVEKLRKIANSAYWRNTFLFCIGYLNKNRRHILDSVESICHELNGSSESYEDYELYNISKCGSRLALDILKEGILNEQPIHENKFAKFLRDLFELSPSDEHTEFLKLSNSIRQNWVAKFIEEFLQKDNVHSQMTAWTICGYFLKHGFDEIEIIMERNWPKDSNEITIIKHFLELGLNSNSWFLNKFTEAIKKYDTFTFSNELSNSKLLYNLKVYANDLEVRKKLLENLFIFCMNVRDNDINYSEFLFYYAYNQDYNMPGSKYRYQDMFEDIEIPIVENIYRIRTHKLKITSEYVTELNRIFFHQKIDYIYALLIFFIDPNKNNFLLFWDKLKKMNVKDKVYIINNMRYMNWFLGKMFYYDESIEEVEKNIENWQFGDIAEWLVFEDKFIKGIQDIQVISNYPFFAGRSMSMGMQKEFWDKFLIIFHKYRNYEDNVKFSLMKEFISACRLSVSSGFYKHLESNENVKNTLSLVTLELLKSCKLDDYRKAACLYIFLTCIKKESLMQFIKDEEDWLEKVLSCGDFVQLKLWNLTKNFDELNLKLVKVLSEIIELQIESSLINYYVQLLINIGVNKYFFEDKISLKTLIHYQPIKIQNKIAKLILVICQYGNNKSILDEIFQSIENEKYIDSTYINEILGYLKILKIKDIYIAQKFVNIYKLIDIKDYSAKSDFETWFKNVLENKNIN